MHSIWRLCIIWTWALHYQGWKIWSKMECSRSPNITWEQKGQLKGCPIRATQPNSWTPAAKQNDPISDRSMLMETWCHNGNHDTIKGKRVETDSRNGIEFVKVCHSEWGSRIYSIAQLATRPNPDNAKDVQGRAQRNKSPVTTWKALNRMESTPVLHNQKQQTKPTTKVSNLYFPNDNPKDMDLGQRVHRTASMLNTIWGKLPKMHLSEAQLKESVRNIIYGRREGHTDSRLECGN